MTWNRLPAVLLVSILGAALGACSWLPLPSTRAKEQQAAEAARRAASERTPAPSAWAQDGSKRVLVDGVEVERVEFRAGASSVTVENMAKQAGCTGGPGAGLLSAPGPVEIYRMACSNGQVFMAKCELRQCKPLR